MDRRAFLSTAALGGILCAIATACATERVRPKILLRNGWQSQNIGDIAHYIGMFELMERYGINTDADVYLWPVTVGDGADALIAANFPWVRVANDKQAKDRAIADCNFMIHGSGARFSAQQNVEDWIQSGKPFGVFGISLNSMNKQTIETLSKGEFVFFRDTVSLKAAQDAGCSAPVVEFGLDTAFGMVKTRNDAAALAFMREHGLEDGRFMCCIPRYRVTPSWELPGHDGPINPDALALNDAMKEHDHAPLRAAIEAVTRTGMKVLVTCEDQTQIRLGKELLVDPLPDEVKERVVWRDRYLLPDEAVSIYVRSAGLFGNEMHSPILCIANGVPAVVCRFNEQGNKGFMWRDIGLGDWLFDLDDPQDVEKLVPTVLEIARNRIPARAKADEARELVRTVQDENFGVLAAALRDLKPPTT